MSRIKSAFWGSISSQVFMVVSMMLGMVTTPFILKFLDKEEYGLSTILFQILGYLSMFDFGLGSAITRFLAATRGEDKEAKEAFNKIISTSFFTYSILGLFVILTGSLLSPFIPQLFDMNPKLSDVAISIAFTLSIFIGIQFPLRVFSSIFYAHQRQVLSNTNGFIMGLFNLVLPVVFLYYNQALWSFVYTNIIMGAISIIVTIILLRKYYPYLRIRLGYFQKSLLSEMFGFGFFLFLNTIAVQVIFFTDRFFIGSLVSLSAVTIYYLTAKAPEICMNLVFKITDNAYPAMVEINTKHGEDRLKFIHNKLLLVTVCCVSIAFWIVLILDYWFLELWVGANFFAGQQILLLTLMLMVMHSILHVSVICLNGAGLVKGFSIVSIIEAGINLALSLWLGKLFGIKGILMATLIASLLTSLWYTPYTTTRYMKMSWGEYFIKPILSPLFLISGFGIVLYLITNKFLQTLPVSWPNFIMVAGLLTLLFVSFVWLVFLRKEFSDYIPIRFKKILLVS